MKTLAALLLCLFMAPAFATGSHALTPVNLSNNVSQDSVTKSSASSRSKSAAKSSADARSQATSGSLSRASGGKSQSVSTGGSANTSASQSLNNQNSAAGGSSNVTVASPASADAAASNGDQEVTIHGDTTNYEAPRLPVATAVAGGTNTTADCRYSVGAGAQGTFLGLSFGLGRKDRDCERRQLADYFYSKGNPDAGDVIMCRIRELREAFGEDCLAMLIRARVLAKLPGAPAEPTQRQLEQRDAFERGDHLK